MTYTPEELAEGSRVVDLVAQRIGDDDRAFMDAISEGRQPAASPSASEIVDAALSALASAQSTSPAAVAEALEDATYHVVQLASDAASALEDGGSIDDDWPEQVRLYALDEALEDGLPGVAQCLSEGVKAVQELRLRAVRFDESRARGRPMRPVAPSIGGAMLEDALRIAGVVGARAGWAAAAAAMTERPGHP